MYRAALAALVAAACRFGFDPLDHPGDALADAPIDAVPPTCGARAVDLVPPSGRVTGTFASLADNATGSCGGDAVADAVFAIDVPEGGSLLVATDLPATTADTLIHVRRDCEDPASEVECDRSGGNAVQAAYRIARPGAGRYYVFIDGDAGATGIYDASIQVLLPAGAACDPSVGRDVCDAELACTSGTCQPAGCVLAATVAQAELPYTASLSTTSAPNHHAGTCGEGNDGGARGNEVVVAVELAATARLRVSTDDNLTTFDTLVYIRDACAGAEVACDDDGGTAANRSVVTTNTLSPGTYYVFIDAFSHEAGNARVTIEAL